MIASLIGIPGKMKTLLDRITSGRAANLDNLNATISSRAAAATALSNAVWTDALSAQMGHATNRCQHFTSSGTWTKPNGVEWVSVIMWGGGGGGGGGGGRVSGLYVAGTDGVDGQNTSVSASSVLAYGGKRGLACPTSDIVTTPDPAETYLELTPFVFRTVRGGKGSEPGSGGTTNAAFGGEVNLPMQIASGRSSGSAGASAGGIIPARSGGGGGGGAGYGGNGTNGTAGSNTSVWVDASSAAANSGAGGGGGGGVSDDPNRRAFGGGGGSGGVLVMLDRVRVTGNVTVTVGSGGAGGTGGNTGGLRGGNGGAGGSGGCIIFW